VRLKEIKETACLVGEPGPVKGKLRPPCRGCAGESVHPFQGRGSAALIRIVVTDDVVFAEIFAELHLDDLNVLGAEVFEPVPVPLGGCRLKRRAGSFPPALRR
jgi:hypothetical protein